MDRDKYIGKRLEGRYDIQEIIGMGGMSNVYKAYDTIDERDVAVKILRDEYLGNEEFLRRFKNESKAIAVLSHPNIVRVFDVSFTGQVHSIVMEYIDGITLKDYIERQSVLTWKEAVHFTLQILRALQHAHDKGIVHRDIKPQNIMMLQNGSIKVTDFGIARFARSEIQTITDRAIGSVHYISPEQAMGDNTDEKSDLYSVGVMLFEMLTGRLPFEADSAVSVAIKQIQTQAARPTTINPDIPEGLEDITLRAMQKDAARRYQSAAEMIADLEKFKEDPAIRFSYAYGAVEEGGGRGKKNNRFKTETREEDTMSRKQRTPYIPILTGVTLAFILATVGFLALMVYNNNPFAATESISVPNYVGVKLETAMASKDKVQVKEVQGGYSDEYPKGVIYEQYPKAGGMKIKENSTIEVKVSQGPRQVILQNYTNRSALEVMQKLREDGLEPREQQQYSDTVPLGCVIYTDPSKNMTLSPGDVVTVFVSMGPEEQPVEIPSDLIGMNLEQAERFLEFYALQKGEVIEEVSDLPDGTIIRTEPAVGTWHPEGTIVNLYISKGGSRKLTIEIPLPRMSEPITITAYNEANEQIDQGVDIDTSQQSSWSPIITGQEGQVMEIRFFIRTPTRKGKLYQTYEFDVDANRAYKTKDRSDTEDFQD